MIKIKKVIYQNVEHVVFSISEHDKKADHIIDRDELLKRAFEDGVDIEDERTVEQKLIKKFGGFCVTKLEVEDEVR